MKDFAEGAPLFVGLGNIGGRRLVDRAEGAPRGAGLGNIAGLPITRKLRFAGLFSEHGSVYGVYTKR
ncbi:hypothetical protein ETC03_00510 [Geobacillus sp. MMMUD3]|nr:hypothetical protein [Geobacillus sp. MMMUD3]